MTGSRIQRSDASSVGPLTTLTADDIAAAAPTSAGDLLQALPGVGVSLNSNGTQGTSFGVSSINLRYLGSAEGSGNRTLVLVDGHRWVNAVGGRGFRDLGRRLGDRRGRNVQLGRRRHRDELRQW